MINKIKNFSNQYWFIPTVTLILTLVSYGLLTPKLGFYLDDWPKLYSLIVRGTEGIKTYYLHDGRPFGFWPDLLFFKLLGTNPILWHLMNYVLRWLVGIFLWVLCRQLWPAHKREAGWIAIIFAIFPSFHQQSMGEMFIIHWTCYLLFVVSLCLMVAAVRSKKFTVPLLILSLLTNLPVLFTLENFIGIEFIRPFILWFAFSEERINRKRIKRVFLYYLPFLLLALSYVAWRLFFMENLRSELTVTLLYNLHDEPLATLFQLATFVVRDVWLLTIGIWYQTFNANMFDFAVGAKNFALLLSAFVIAIPIWLLTRIKKQGNGDLVPPKDKFHVEGTILGLIGIVLGCSPGWIFMRSVSDPTGLWNDRFGLAALFSASIFLVGLVNSLFKQNRHLREIALIVLVGLAVGYNFSITDEYRVSAKAQNQFFSQLKWRAPTIQSQTSIVAENELFPKMGVYPTSFALNLLYPPVQQMPRSDYWFFTNNKFLSKFPDEVESGMLIDTVKWYVYFEAQSENTLVINWDDTNDTCVWVLTQNDRYNPWLSADTVKILGLSNLQRIDTKSDEGFFPQDLFGKENTNTWCYYFEKADLARQEQDWQKVVQLYIEAQSKNINPANGMELMPFIEGFARTGDAERSSQLTFEAIEKTDDISPFLCDNWNRFAPMLVEGSEVEEFYQSFKSDYSCAIYLDED